eukprot:3032502-Amphidinium_carterae.1
MYYGTMRDSKAAEIAAGAYGQVTTTEHGIGLFKICIIADRIDWAVWHVVGWRGHLQSWGGRCWTCYSHISGRLQEQPSAQVSLPCLPVNYVILPWALLGWISSAKKLVEMYFPTQTETLVAGCSCASLLPWSLCVPFSDDYDGSFRASYFPINLLSWSSGELQPLVVLFQFRLQCEHARASACASLSPSRSSARAPVRLSEEQTLTSTPHTIQPSRPESLCVK